MPSVFVTLKKKKLYYCIFWSFTLQNDCLLLFFEYTDVISSAYYSQQNTSHSVRQPSNYL